MKASEGYVICPKCGGDEGSAEGCPKCGGVGEVPAKERTHSALFGDDPGYDDVDLGDDEEDTPKKQAPAQASTKLTAREIGLAETGFDFSNLQGALQFAELAISTGMLPRHLKTAGQVVMVMQAGRDVGMPFTTAINYIVPINNRLTIWGEGAKGLVEASGLLTGWMEWWTVDGERVDIHKRTDLFENGLPDSLTAHTRLNRRGGAVIERTFSVADAKRYQVRSNRGGYSGPLFNKPGPWRDDPMRMLRVRSFSRAMRDLFADCLGGLGITEEERDTADVQEPADTEYTTVTADVTEIGPKKGEVE